MAWKPCCKPETWSVLYSSCFQGKLKVIVKITTDRVCHGASHRVGRRVGHRGTTNHHNIRRLQLTTLERLQRLQRSHRMQRLQLLQLTMSAAHHVALHQVERLQRLQRLQRSRRVHVYSICSSPRVPLTTFATHHVGAFAAFAPPAALILCATFTAVADHHVCSSHVCSSPRWTVCSVGYSICIHHVCSSPRLQLTALECCSVPALAALAA